MNLRLFICALFVAMLGGCATPGGAIDPQLTQLIMSLVGQATGVAIGGKGCIAPPIPPEVLNACQPALPSATPEQLQALLFRCVTDSAVQTAIVRYQQKICTPTVP